MKEYGFFAISRRQFLATSGSLLVASQLVSRSFADDQDDIELLRQKTIQRGLKYLKERGQAKNGGFSSFAGTGPTSLAVAAMLRCGLSPDDPAVAKGLGYLKGKVHDDGGIYGLTWFLNYETCAAIEVFHLANQDGRYDELLKKAERFIRKNQWDESRKKESGDLYYGGEGYGGDSRPDLSNTAYMLDALKRCGAKKDDPALQKALVFVSRCQNAESSHNTTKFATLNPDGGFYYTCCESGGGRPQARQSRGGDGGRGGRGGRGGGGGEQNRTLPNGGLRSYGSMSYAGLKSMIYCGLDENDPRVKAVVGWVQKNYTVKSNPGMKASGLFYYYNMFAKSLNAFGHDEITTSDGKKHDWRADLIAELAERQREDGAWRNQNTRWMEGDPNLCTAFALLALSYCKEKGPSRKREKDSPR